MNKIDKWVYEALVFFSNKSLNESLKIKEDNPKKYNKKVPKSVENSMHREGYISFKKYEDARDEDSAITSKGIEQLRILEDIKKKEQSIWISIGALIISIGAVIVSWIALNQ